MARQGRPAEAPAEKDHNIKVTRAKQFQNGNISFDMEIDGISIHQMGLIIPKDKDKEAFFTFPQYKGSDGKYYHHAYVKLTEADKKSIDSQLDSLL